MGILKTLGGLALSTIIFGVGLFMSIDATKQRNPIDLSTTNIASVSEGDYVSLSVSNIGGKKTSDSNTYYTTKVSGTYMTIKTGKKGSEKFDYMFEHPFLTQGSKIVDAVTGSSSEKKLFKVVHLQGSETKSNLSNVNGLILEEQETVYKDYMWIIFYAVTGIAVLTFLDILTKPFRKPKTPNVPIQ